MKSAYNLGNAGLASQVLRTMDLMRSAVVESSSDLGIEAVFFWLTKVGISLSRWVVLVLLVERLCIVPIWCFEISQSRLSVTRMRFLLWKALEKVKTDFAPADLAERG